MRSVIMFGEPQGTVVAAHYLEKRSFRVSWQADGSSRVEQATTMPEPGVWIAPGLFDLQVNGYAGVDFQQDELSVEQLLHAAGRLRAAGCSRFLLTLITDKWEKLLSRLKRLTVRRSGSPELRAAIAGWHIEGPFLSELPGFHGAHDPALMLDPAPEHIRELRAITGSDPVLLTIAPERKGALEAIRLAVSLGMKVSLGHSDAPTDVLERAVEEGAGTFTHLGNGCPTELNRRDNILWRVLDESGLSISVIPDGVHVSPALFRIMHRLMAERILYVTDAMSAAGAPPGRYTLGPLCLEVGEDRIVRRPGQPYLAGSALEPLQGVKRAVHMLGCSWQEAWKRYSEVPAESMSLPPAPPCLVRTAGNDIIEVKPLHEG